MLVTWRIFCWLLGSHNQCFFFSFLVFSYTRVFTHNMKAFGQNVGTKSRFFKNVFWIYIIHAEIAQAGLPSSGWASQFRLGYPGPHCCDRAADVGAPDVFLWWLLLVSSNEAWSNWPIIIRCKGERLLLCVHLQTVSAPIAPSDEVVARYRFNMASKRGGVQPGTSLVLATIWEAISYYCSY